MTDQDVSPSGGVVRALRDAIAHGNPFTSPSPVTDADLKRAYRRHPSITDKLPWIDLVGANGDTVLLEDARSVGAVFELDQLAVEGRSQAYLVSIRDALQQFVRESCARYPAGQSPWVFSIYAKREKATFRDIPEAIRRYAKDMQKQNPHPFTDYYIDKVLGPHFEDLAQDSGLFKDDLSGLPWGGCVREIRLVVYRRISATQKQRVSADKELDQVCKRIALNLRSASVEATRLNGEEIRYWLARWLNPRPMSTGGDAKKFCDLMPSIDPEDRPVDWSLADDVTSRSVRSDKDKGIWWFDEMPHTVLSVERLRSAPAIGQMTAERILGGEAAGARSLSVCMLDQLPPGATIVLTFTPVDDSLINRHLDRIDRSSKADTAQSNSSREASAHARTSMIKGNLVFPFSMAVALRAEDEDALDEQILDVDALLIANNLQLIDPVHDNYRLDSYIRHLPFAYDPRLDQTVSRSRLIYTQHLTNLLPIYGRGRGSGRPGLSFFNRGGEPFMCDPLSLGDRSKNAHLFLFGPTGAGKSATLVYLMMHYMAIYKPRLIIVEAGNSFGLMTEYMENQGFKVSDMVLAPGKGAQIPVFRDALFLLDDMGEPIDYSALNQDDDETDTRDYMGEMMLKARLMITGGTPKEEERFSQSDQAMLRTAIIESAKNVFRKNSGKSVPMTISDMVETVESMACKEEGHSRDRLSEMAKCMSLFCSGFEGQLFNTTESSWDKSADIVRVEMKTLANPNYQDRLALAYIGLINEAMAMAEANQMDGRPTIMLTDEGHVITTNRITAEYKVLISKLSGRRMGFWIWDATQNLKDYPDEAEKMLAMFEWWVCLFVGKSELKEVKRFRTLSSDEESMVLSAKKQSGKYTEGCFLSDNIFGQFRNVPPALCLALAQTEKEEKTARGELMASHNCSELAAAEMIGDSIARGRRS